MSHHLHPEHQLLVHHARRDELQRAARHRRWVREAWRHAQALVDEMAEAPEPVFVLDLAETPNGLRVVELNPFSGADLYACDPDAVVRAVAVALGA